MRHPHAIAAVLGIALAACNTDPSDQLDQTVDYRDGLDGGPMSGERGTVKITEVLWSGSVTDDGTYDADDVFVEFRNEGNRPINISRWRLTVSGTVETTWRLPDLDGKIDVGGHLLIAAKTTGCFPDADGVIEGLSFPTGDGFRLTLHDADERLMEPVGSETMPPFAGGYDLVTSYAMERINLMFGGVGSEPQSWHFYNRVDCPSGVEGVGLSCFEDIPNNDRVREDCRQHTLASPGRPNSPDYSGAYASGGFE